MNNFIYTVALAIGTALVLIAIFIISIGYLWHIAKPTIEKTELRYMKDLNKTNE